MRQTRQVILFNSWLAVIFAMALTIIPWPTPILNWMPDWVLLVLIHQSLYTPETINVGKAWFIGLLVDVLTGQLLGQYALAYSVSIYLSIRQHKRIRHHPMIQQSLFVVLILLVAQIIIFSVERIHGQFMPLQFWFPVLTGGFTWLAILILMHNICFFINATTQSTKR